MQGVWVLIVQAGCGWLNAFYVWLLNGPRREKTGFLHMLKQRRRSASR